jgi:hypothetical protein
MKIFKSKIKSSFNILAVGLIAIHAETSRAWIDFLGPMWKMKVAGIADHVVPAFLNLEYKDHSFLDNLIPKIPKLTLDQICLSSFQLDVAASVEKANYDE